MLVLTRKPGEKVIIGGNISITVAEIRGNKVRLAIDAPNNVAIMREELIIEGNCDLSEKDLQSKPAEWKSEEYSLVY